jgi:hypothetical protein
MHSLRVNSRIVEKFKPFFYLIINSGLRGFFGPECAFGLVYIRH